MWKNFARRRVLLLVTSDLLNAGTSLSFDNGTLTLIVEEAQENNLEIMPMQISDEDCIFTVILQRLNKYHMPVLLKLKQKVEAGEELDPAELLFLDGVFKATHDILPKVNKRPEYKKIFANAIRLYIEITELALNNIQKSQGTK